MTTSAGKCRPMAAVWRMMIRLQLADCRLPSGMAWLKRLLRC